MSITSTEAAVLEVWRAWHAEAEEAEKTAEGYKGFFMQGYASFGKWAEDEVTRLISDAAKNQDPNVIASSELW